MNYDDVIEAALKQGDSVEQIAAAFSKALNKREKILEVRSAWTDRRGVELWEITHMRWKERIEARICIWAGGGKNGSSRARSGRFSPFSPGRGKGFPLYSSSPRIIISTSGKLFLNLRHAFSNSLSASMRGSNDRNQ